MIEQLFLSYGQLIVPATGVFDVKLYGFRGLIICVLMLCACSSASKPSLHDAVGQMMMVGFRGTQIKPDSPIVQAIKKYHIGGVIIFRSEFIHGKKVIRNIQNPQQLKTLTMTLQYYARKYHDAPLLIATNQEGGRVDNLLKKDGFKLGANESQKKLGERNDLNAIKQQSYQRGKLLHFYGINLNLAPVADLNTNPNNPAIAKVERSFGSNPQKVTQDLKAAINGYQKAKIFCALKHFPGFGSANKNTDYASVNVSHTWSKQELIPYKQLITMNESCRFIMVAHTLNKSLTQKNGLETSLSPRVVIDLLQKKLHYKGVIMTDDMDAAAIRNQLPMKKAIEQAVLAGNNIILYGGTFGHDPSQETKQLYEALYSLAEKKPKIRKNIISSYLKLASLKNMLMRRPH